MYQLKEMPNLQSQLNIIKILIELSEKVEPGTNQIAITIRTAINNNDPTNEVFDFIKDAAIDNYILVAETIGADLLNEIIHI